MSGRILVTREGDIATVTLSNPEKLNAVNYAMWCELADNMRTLGADDSLRCVILRGEGAAFAAGGDLEEFLVKRSNLEQALNYHEKVGEALDAVRACPHPTVAQIRGACVGGGLEIAGNCDLRIASDNAKFGAPINKLGFSMYPGEMSGLLALAGVAVMSEILLEGRILDAGEAYAKGLLTRVVADAQLEDEVTATTRRIAAGAPLVARWHKQWMRRLATGVPLTQEEKAASFAFLDTADYKEGLDAFLAKRKPVFKGR